MEIQVFNYSDKTFILVGKDTRKIKDDLKSKCDATWNKSLNGWLVKKSKQTQLIGILDDVDFSSLENFEKVPTQLTQPTLEKFFIVKGDTKKYRSQFKEIGGTWISNATVSGWLFPHSMKKSVRQLLRAEHKEKIQH